MIQFMGHDIATSCANSQICTTQPLASQGCAESINIWLTSYELFLRIFSLLLALLFSSRTLDEPMLPSSSAPSTPGDNLVRKHRLLFLLCTTVVSEGLDPLAVPNKELKPELQLKFFRLHTCQQLEVNCVPLAAKRLSARLSSSVSSFRLCVKCQLSHT